MTGASLFLHEHTNAWYLTRANASTEWTWDKSEYASADEDYRRSAYFDVLVTAAPEAYARSHEVVERVRGYDGINLRKASVRMTDKVFIMLRRQ